MAHTFCKRFIAAMSLALFAAIFIPHFYFFAAAQVAQTAGGPLPAQQNAAQPASPLPQNDEESTAGPAASTGGTSPAQSGANGANPLPQGSGWGASSLPQEDENPSPTAVAALLPSTGWYTANPGAQNFFVANAEELAGLALLVNSGSESFAGKTIFITNNINLAGQSWQPIGTEEAPFSGRINGQGLAINKLSLPASLALQGLFGYISGAEISDLILNATTLNESNAQAEATAALAAIAQASVITNCSALNLNINVENDTVGGIVATAYSSQFYGCTVSGSINAGYNVGGIVADVYFATGNNTNVIKNCVNNANISSQNYTGGIVGFMRYNKNGSNTIAGCVNTGNISGKNYVAGIAGNFAGGEISSSISKGAVAGTAYVGGIAGRAMGNIKNCHTSGSISGSAAGQGNIGGIVGWQDSFGLEYCLSTSPVSGGQNVGGIAGRLSNANGTPTLKNVVAINLSVTASSGVLAGRVCGFLPAGTVYGAATAWAHMKLNGGYVAPSAENGENADLTMLKNPQAWQAGFKQAPWLYTNGACPVLGGIAVAQNSKIAPHVRNYIDNPGFATVVDNLLGQDKTAFAVEAQGEQKPDFQLYYNGALLTEGRDYTLAITAVAGTQASCEIQGIGDHAGVLRQQLTLPEIKVPEPPEAEKPDVLPQLPPLPANPQMPENNQAHTPPKTGDGNGIFLAAEFMAFSGLGLCAVVANGKRRIKRGLRKGNSC